MKEIANKKLKIIKLNKIFWCLLKKNNLLVVTLENREKKYIKLLSNVNITKTNKTYFFSHPRELKFPYHFFTFIYKWLENFYKPFQNNLFFKGLGFKVRFSDKNKTKLEFKLGHSHLTSILLPKTEIKIFLIKKNKIALKSFNKTLLGNFMHKIRILRFPDSYNGKGFWYKNEFRTLKEIKKT